MPSEPVDIGTVLTNRLIKIGIEPESIPGLLKDMYNSFYHEPGISRERINNKLQSLGWLDLELDYHTYILAEANFQGYAKTVYPDMLRRHPGRKPVLEVA